MYVCCDCSWTVSCRLPLPGCLLTMFPEELDPQTEDRSLHGGRIRSFKHERGNWATYVYLPCECVSCVYPGCILFTYSTFQVSIPGDQVCNVACILCVILLHFRPTRGGLCRAPGQDGVSSQGSRCGFEPPGGVPPECVSDGGAETSLDPALHTEPQDRPDAPQKVSQYKTRFGNFDPVLRV